MECAYCVAIVLNRLYVFLIFVNSFISKLFIDGMCVMALAHATKTMNVATLQSLVAM